MNYGMPYKGRKNKIAERNLRSAQSQMIAE